MRLHADRLVSVEYEEALSASIARALDLLRELRVSPWLQLRVEGSGSMLESACSSKGFRLLPTGPKTTVFYDGESDCFFKILHRRPSTLWGRAHSLIADRARQIHALSQRLTGHGIPLPRVRAFGTLRAGRRPFYAVERVHGRSLYDLLIRERRALPAELSGKVIDAVARLHGLGYRLGDAHLSHVFVHEEEVNGFIDIDSIGRNRPSDLNGFARDLAGLNHPGLSLGRTEARSLLRRYAAGMNIDNEEAFHRLIKFHSARRWRTAP